VIHIPLIDTSDPIDDPDTVEQIPCQLLPNNAQEGKIHHPFQKQHYLVALEPEWLDLKFYILLKSLSMDENLQAKVMMNLGRHWAESNL
jgi:desulfoferrodoxin (superoxide reductase-like protein)